MDSFNISQPGKWMSPASIQRLTLQSWHLGLSSLETILEERSIFTKDQMISSSSSSKVAALAQDLLHSVQWSDAIESADWPRIFSVVDKVSGDMAGYIAPYNEYYLVAYLANMTSPPGSKASQHFATFMVPVLRLVPMATQCRSPTRASTCSLTTTTTTS